MATLRLRVESYTCRHQSACIASDPMDGGSHRRFRDTRWVRIWTVRGSTYSRGDLAHLLQQSEAGGLGGAEWDWTPPGAGSPIKVTALAKLPVDMRNATSNSAEFEITECLSPDT